MSEPNCPICHGNGCAMCRASEPHKLSRHSVDYRAAAREIMVMLIADGTGVPSEDVEKIAAVIKKHVEAGT